MNNTRHSIAFLGVVLSLITCAADAVEITDVGPRHCKQGLLTQEGSDFSLYVFCDDALGTQIGVIYTKRGVGPVERGTDWSTTNRFWQEGTWMTDVNQLLWAPSGEYLYVATGMAYSDNSLYELDLRHRKANKLYSGGADESPIQLKLAGRSELSVNGHTFNIK